MTITAPPPGTRIVVRDAEWIVGRVDLLPGGGPQLNGIGGSELGGLGA